MEENTEECGVGNHPEIDRSYEVTWDFGPTFSFNKDRYVTIRFKRFGDVFKKNKREMGVL